MNKFYKPQILLSIKLICMVLMVGCNANHSSNSDINIDIQFGQNGRIAKIYDIFNGIERGSLEVENGQRICFEYEAIVQMGSLTIKWLDPSGVVVWEKVLSEGASGTEEIVSESHGSYSIIIQGQDTGGSFNVTWDGE
jgi:hypothetical protein